LKPLQANIGKALEDTGIGKNFPNRTPIAHKIRTRRMKMHQILKLLYSTGNNYQNEETIHIVECIFASYSWEK
jgi:hypothetical protein